MGKKILSTNGIVCITGDYVWYLPSEKLHSSRKLSSMAMIDNLPYSRITWKRLSDRLVYLGLVFSACL